MEPLEIEVKFYLHDTEQLRRRILSLGPVRRGRLHEVNIRFDDTEEGLRSKSAMLRLRKDDRIRLTYKSPPAEPDARFKVYRELETEVGSLEVMIQILEALGYRKIQVYEKWRETFVWGQCLLCLDQMPYGDFLEIEGPAARIRPAAERLGLNWKTRILANYLEMFDTIRQGLGLPFRDLTFENCRNHAGAFATQLQRFTVS